MKHLYPQHRKGWQFKKERQLCNKNKTCESHYGDIGAMKNQKECASVFNKTLFTDCVSETDNAYDRFCNRGGYYFVGNKKVPFIFIYLLMFPFKTVWDCIKTIPIAFWDGCKKGWKK